MIDGIVKSSQRLKCVAMLPKLRLTNTHTYIHAYYASMCVSLYIHLYGANNRYDLLSAVGHKLKPYWLGPSFYNLCPDLAFTQFVQLAKGEILYILNYMFQLGSKALSFYQYRCMSKGLSFYQHLWLIRRNSNSELLFDLRD